MEFLKNIGKAVGEAVSFVGEKNRKAAYLNRIRAVVRCEEKAAEREYLALGRYYYNNLRDSANPVTEAHCAAVEEIEARLDKALAQMEAFYSASHEASAIAVIGDDCEEDCEEVTLDDVQEIAPEEVSAEEALPAVESAMPAGPDENDSLPFEG